jgi:hypothetical protein
MVRSIPGWQIWDGHIWLWHEDVPPERMICAVCGLIGAEYGAGWLMVDNDRNLIYLVPCAGGHDDEDEDEVGAF